MNGSSLQPQQQEEPQCDHQLHVIPLHKEKEENEQEKHISAVQLVQLEAFEQ